MKKKCNYFVYLILFVCLTLSYKSVLCQSILPKILHMDNIGINDTLFTQNLHYSIYKLADLYEYYYIQYPSVGMDFQKIPMYATDDIPEIYKCYLTEHASMFTFKVSKGSIDDTLFSYYNGEFFGYYFMIPYWKSPHDNNGNASLYPESFFYDTNKKRMFLSDSLSYSLQLQINQVLKENYLKAKENDKTESISNYRYVFFEYDYGEKPHLIDSGINATTCINLSSEYIKEFQHVLKDFCEKNNCSRIRFSCRVPICD